MPDWPIVAVRFALYLSLGGLFGLSAFGLYGLRAGERDTALALRPWLVAGAASGLLLSAFSLALLVASMAGTPVWPVDPAAVGAVLSGSAVGTAWFVRIAALVLAGLAALVATRGPGLSVVALASGVALATLAWTGHGAAGEGAIGWAHLLADILHLIAAGAWVGALIGLMLLVVRPAKRVDAAHLTLTHRALHGFGSVGTLVVATLIVTGLVSGWALVGVDGLAALGTVPYGRLLLAKLVLFVAMLGLAALNRFRLTPAFEHSIATGDHTGALGALRWSLGVETACAVMIFALVGWLGTLEPSASTV